MATYTGADKALSFLFDIAASIAADYDATATYATDAYVIYEGTLYKCTTAISTPETFNPTHWQAVLVMDEVAAGGGGGGGGTTVIANPSGAATDILNKLQVGPTIYSIPSGGGGGGSHIWAESEHEVGRWIDEKPVYEKTVQTGAINVNTTFQQDLGISDLAQVIDIRVLVVFASGNVTILPYMSIIPNNTQQYGIALDIYNISTGKLGIVTGVQRSVANAFITIQYTKTIETNVYERALENGSDIRTTENGDTRQTENTTGA